MHPFQHLGENDVVLDSLPDEITAAMEVRSRFMNGITVGGESGGVGLEFVVADLQRWIPGQTIRVAFLDGDEDVWSDVRDAVQQINDACNLTLDFGSDGNFRRWSEQDTDRVAEIRVSFDKPGYFSLVGTDSVDPTLGSPFGQVGGRPHQASLNLGGFAEGRPPRWQGTVRHEFLHALGFHHSHQNMRGPCQASFRWEDDPGYQPTQSEAGAFIPDAEGRRPGIYTYLAGYPNFWGRDKVDHNLKTEEDPNVVAGPFDPESVMLYRFPPDFYKSLPSPCAPQGDGLDLSDGDKRGLRLLYPPTAAEAAAEIERQRSIFSEIARLGRESGAAALESGIGQVAQIGAMAEVMRLKLEAVQ